MAMQERKNEELEVYCIDLEILSGHGLAAKDLDGSSDPFVKVIIGDRERETKVIENSLNPVFNAKFTFKFFADPKVIKFEVWDKDKISNDILGFAEYSLDEQFGSSACKPFNGHLKLNNDKNKKKAKGTIKVKISAQKYLPLSLEKIAAQQKETISKQNREINNLNEENKNTKKEYESLKKREEREQSEQSKGGQPGSLRIQKATKRNATSDIFGEYFGGIIIKIISVWHYILRRCIYGFPIFGYYIDLFVLFFGSLLRLEVGYNVFRGATSSKRPPNKLLKLYEYESNTDCKMVRETLCALDLDCIIYPCPGPDHYLSRYRDEAKKLCGKSDNFPLLIDENYGDDGPLILMSSSRIIRYLYDEYGNNVKKTMPERIRYYIASQTLSQLIYKYFYLKCLRCLPEQGNQRYVDTVKPNKLLELWSYEASPFCIKVREVLSSLELPYILKNVAVGSQQKRQEFQIRFGKKYPKWRQKLHLIQVPLLIDPNTEKEIFESKDIKNYLIKTYCIN